MSILLDAPPERTNLVTRDKCREPGTHSILIVSGAISIAVVLLVFGGMSIGEAWWQDYSICTEKIIGYEQMGLYKTTDDFMAALSYCDSK